LNVIQCFGNKPIVADKAAADKAAADKDTGFQLIPWINNKFLCCCKG